MLQRPTHDGFVEMHHHHQQTQHHADDAAHEQKVHQCAVVGAQRQPFDAEPIGGEQHDDAQIDVIGKFFAFRRPFVRQQIVCSNGHKRQCQRWISHECEHHAACQQQIIGIMAEFFGIQPYIEKQVNQGGQHDNTQYKG